jgi:hypothetical protein
MTTEEEYCYLTEWYLILLQESLGSQNSGLYKRYRKTCETMIYTCMKYNLKQAAENVRAYKLLSVLNLRKVACISYASNACTNLQDFIQNYI